MKPLSPRLRVWLSVGLVVVVLLGGVAAWVMLPPRALSFAGGHGVSLAAYKGPTPVGAPAELRSDSLIARGKYLTQAADCEMCHTREGGQPYAGGRAFKTPFGVLYSPNITADRETGIGAWTDDDLIRALHRGIDKEGERRVFGNDFMQQLEALYEQLVRERGHPDDIAVWPIETRHQTLFDGVLSHGKDNGNCARCSQRRACPRRSIRKQRCQGATNQIGRHFGQAFVPLLSPTVLNAKVSAFYIA